MPNIMTDENIIVDRNYTDNFSVKKDAIEKLGSKYFGDMDLSALNVGELGFVLEQMSNISEDVFNTIATLVNESFPNRAVIPESLYSHAAIFQIDNSFVHCGRCAFVMLLDAKEILKYGKSQPNMTTTYIDKKTIFTVIDKDADIEIPFTLDYDIKITAQKKQIKGSGSEINFSAKYILDMKNSISEISDPYLKIMKIPGDKLLLHFTAHQVQRTEITENITTNTKINYPSITFNFDDNLAGFDVFYKSPTDKDFTQLEKLIKYSIPSKHPFCYYKMKNDNTMELTFSTRDGYFKPDFNSEIKIIMYTTLGTKGTFSLYSGSNIEVQPCPDTYPYNSSITIAIKPVSDCSGATEKMDLEALRALIVEAYSTATEISTEHDIMTYFYNYKYRYGNEMLVIKRRDDITERLFSAFLLLKKNEYIYPTNTLNLEIRPDDYDCEDDKGRFSLKPGHVFRYKSGSTDTVELIPNGTMAYEKEKIKDLMEENDFLYTNPFLISMTKNPSLVGLYKTVVNQTSILEFISSNEDQFVQFITSKITLNRRLTGDSEYTLSLSILPSTTIDSYITNLNTNKDNDVRIIVGFKNSNKEEVGFIEMLPIEIDANDKLKVTFSAKIKTDDLITSNSQIALLNATKINPDAINTFIPISNESVSVYILYFDALTEKNKFTPYFDDMQYFSVTNVYNCDSDPLTFIEPMNMIRSYVTFSNLGSETNPRLYARLTLLPMIKADIVSDEDDFDVFTERLTSNYNYLKECLPILRNNTHIDLKFYNTYGKSINYIIGDSGEPIDRINISIKFKIVINDGVDDASIRKNLKTFIKNFIEKINSDGTNDLYISNLIKEIENNFPEVHHLKFLGINDYITDYQTISVREKDLNNLTKEERRCYVPEILVISSDDVLLSIESVTDFQTENT